MKKILTGLLLAMLLVFNLTSCGSKGGGGRSAGNYAWVLTEIKNYEGPFDFSKDYGSAKLDYKPGDYGISWVSGKGGTWAGRCNFSQPPQSIKGGEKVTLDLSIKETENTLAQMWWVEWNVDAYMFLSKIAGTKDIDPHVYFEESDGNRYFELFAGNEADKESTGPTNTSIFVIAPEGKPGDRIQITYNFTFWDAGKIKISGSTTYFYEMKKQ